MANHPPKNSFKTSRPLGGSKRGSMRKGLKKAGKKPSRKRKTKKVSF